MSALALGALGGYVKVLVALVTATHPPFALGTFNQYHNIPHVIVLYIIPHVIVLPVCIIYVKTS